MKRRFKFGIVMLFFIVLMLDISGCAEEEKAVKQLDSGEFTQDQIKTLESIKKLDDFPMYVMTYYGDYGFEEYLKTGKQASGIIKPIEHACTCVAAFNGEDGPVFGRNLDWHACPVLVLYTDSPKGYASISIMDISYLDFDMEKDITKMTLEEKKALLNSPLLSFDGMNEHGLCIGEMTLSETNAPNDPKKITLEANEILRLILDHAKNVEEAIALFQNYNIDFPPAPPEHYLLADPSGKSAVIEFIDGEMKVIYNTEPWQVCTNFKIYGSVKDDWDSCSRYKRASEALSLAQGKISQKEALDIMKEVSVNSTQWSAVYNMKTGAVDIVLGGRQKLTADGEYGRTISLKLDMNQGK